MVTIITPTEFHMLIRRTFEPYIDLKTKHLEFEIEEYFEFLHDVGRDKKKKN